MTPWSTDYYMCAPCNVDITVQNIDEHMYHQTDGEPPIRDVVEWIENEMRTHEWLREAITIITMCCAIARNHSNRNQNQSIEKNGWSIIHTRSTTTTTTTTTTTCRESQHS